jgi:lipid-A-disaccharide synthase
MLPERTAPAYTPAQRPHIGFFPGSRPGAIRKHLPLLEKTAEIIRQKIDCDITVFTLPERQKLFKNSQLSIVTEQDYEQRLALNFAVTVSGTVSLEHTVMGIPMVVFYQLSRLNYYLARLLVRVKYITMANILADREVVPELIQADATPENIAHHVLSLLQSPERYTTMRNELIALRAQLGAPGAAHRAAQLILK